MYTYNTCTVHVYMYVLCITLCTCIAHSRGDTSMIHELSSLKQRVRSEQEERERLKAQVKRHGATCTCTCMCMSSVHVHCTCIVFSLGKQYAMHETLNMAALSLSLSRMKTSIWRWSGYSRKYSLVAHPLEPTSLPDLAPPQQRTRSVLLLLIHACTCTCRCDH